MTHAWNADHVRRVLAERALDIEIRFFDASTATSQLAAEQIGCELGQIAKSIVFLVEDRPVVVVISGDQRIDDRKLAAHFDLPRKRIRTASADECVAVTGYAPGGVPPIAHRRNDIMLFVDQSLNRYRRFSRLLALQTLSSNDCRRLVELRRRARNFAKSVEVNSSQT